MASMMSKLRDEVHPRDHTPIVLSSLRTAVVKYGKEILGLMGEDIIRAFWNMLEDLDEGVIERLAATEAKKKQEPSFHLERLPNDLINSVCQYLDLDTLMALFQTSHKYRKMATDQSTWKQVVLTFYPDMPAGYNKRIDSRGGRYLFDRVPRVHIESAYRANRVGEYPEHYRYKLFTWNLAREVLPLRELVCPWKLMTRELLDAIKVAPTKLEVLRITGTGVVLGSYLEREFAATMVAHKDGLRELDAIPWLPLHVYFERDHKGQWDGIETICDGLGSMVNLEKVSLPLARTRTLPLMVAGLLEHCNVNFRNQREVHSSKIKREHRTCELVGNANRKLVAAARRLPDLKEVIYVLHTKGSIVDTIVDTLEMYLLEDAPEQDELRLIRFEQHPENRQISINSYDDTPNLAGRLNDEDLSGDRELMEVFGGDPTKNVYEYTTLLLKTATDKFITVARSFFERYPHVNLKIQLQGGYWKKMYDDAVLPKIPAQFHHD
jgi:hypothetical protein